MNVNGKPIIVKRVEKEAKSKTLVTFRDISMYGEVIIRFSNPIFVPPNFTRIGPTELDVVYKNA